jgi:pantetheine-phosphate adenylyltransferase
MTKIAIYPGTFDPITLGHLDIVKRSLKMFDKIVIAVTDNPSKSPLFSIEERVELVKQSTKNLKNVKVMSFNSLLVKFAKSQKAVAIIRGLRQVSDFEEEFQLATINRKLHSSIETVFIMTSEKYFYLTSSLVKELALFNAPLNEFVTPFVKRKLKEKMSNVYVI